HGHGPGLAIRESVRRMGGRRPRRDRDRHDLRARRHDALPSNVREARGREETLMARRHQKWAVGDVFVIPLEDGTYAVGHIVGREAQAMTSITIALSDLRVAKPEEARAPDPANVFSVLFATRVSLDRWLWTVVRNEPVRIPRAWFPYEDTRASGWVGAKITG